MGIVHEVKSSQETRTALSTLELLSNIEYTGPLHRFKRYKDNVEDDGNNYPRTTEAGQGLKEEIHNSIYKSTRTEMFLPPRYSPKEDVGDRRKKREQPQVKEPEFFLLKQIRASME